MRDIRSDLEERAHIIQEQMRAAYAHFERMAQQLQSERDEAANRSRAALADNEQRRRDANELLRLRASLTRMSQELAQLKAAGNKVSDEPLQAAADAWAEQAISFKHWFDENPDRSIPELQLLKEGDWLGTAIRNMVVATNDLQRRDYNSIEMIASGLRETSKGKFARILGHALSKYIEANAGALPGDLTQLAPYYAPQTDDYSAVVLANTSILQRYQLLRTGKISDVPQGEPIVTEKAPVDELVDTLLKMQIGGYFFESVGIKDGMAGQLRSWDPTDLERIKPFLK